MTSAVWNGVTIAQSDDTVIVEGNHYFPASSVKMDLLQPSDTTTLCPWKGMANYYSVKIDDGKINRDCVWCYADPSPDALHIKGMFAFWNGVTIKP